MDEVVRGFAPIGSGWNGSAAEGRAVRPDCGLCVSCVISALFFSLALSCELSPNLLSNSERSSLYTISLSAGGRPVGNGSILEAGASLVVSVETMAGSEKPGSLRLSLVSPGGGVAASLQLTTASAPSPSASAPGSPSDGANPPQTVPRIEGSLPPLVLPARMSSGSYRISCLVLSPGGAVLQQSNFVVFVGTVMPSLNAVLAYPPSAEPGSAILLAAVVAKAAGSDPWIVWSRDGRAFAQGPLSAGMDRVVWTAPPAEGAYALSVDLYPCAPPDASGFGFSSPAHQDIKAMVRMQPGGSTDEFAEPPRFYSLLRLAGNFDDLGTGVRRAQPQPFGSPRLDVYSGGFGYRFGPSAGLRLPGLLPPVDGAGRIMPQIILFRIAPDAGQGRLLHFASGDGSFDLDLGLQGGRPYVEELVNGHGSRSVAASALPPGPLVLAALLAPGAGQLGIVWIADGKRIAAPALALPSIPGNGLATLGGPGSLPGVYSDFGLVSDAPPPPLYHLEQLRRWRGALILAEGFESGTLPRGAAASGSVGFDLHGLSLGPGASLRLAAGPRLDRRSLVELEYTGAPAATRLEFFGPGGGRLGSVSGSGELEDGSGRRFGSLNLAPGDMRFVLASEGPALLFVSGVDGRTHRLHVSGGANLAIGFSNDSRIETLHVGHVLIRYADAIAAQ